MLRRVVFATLLATAAIIRPIGAEEQSADSSSHWIDSIFAPYASARSPGCAVGLVHADSLVFAKGYGLADLARGMPITPDTRFYIASLSKQFTAMAIVLLAQDGLLSLDDSIRKWVPEVPSFGTAITLRQLLHHTSGLRDYFALLGVSGWSSDDALTERQFLDLISRQRSLNFVPGDEFLYSNTGYVLLAIVVRRASGQSLRDFAARRIFAPLGMTHTEFRDDHRIVIPQLALGYQLTEGGYRISQPNFDIVGDGGMYSTVGDLAKWEANFRTGRVGGTSGVAELLVPGRLNDGQTVPYGLGLTIGEISGLKTVSHSGAYAGYRSTALRFPDRDLSVIVLCNTSDAWPGLAEEAATLTLGFIPKQVDPAILDLSPTPRVAIDSAAPFDSTAARRHHALFARLAGSYYSDELDLPVTLEVHGAVVLLQRPHADDIRFVAAGDDLLSRSDAILLRVVRDDHDAVTGFTLTATRARDIEFVRRDSVGPHHQ